MKNLDAKFGLEIFLFLQNRKYSSICFAKWKFKQLTFKRIAFILYSTNKLQLDLNSYDFPSFPILLHFTSGVFETAIAWIVIFPVLRFFLAPSWNIWHNDNTEQNEWASQCSQQDW